MTEDAGFSYQCVLIVQSVFLLNLKTFSVVNINLGWNEFKIVGQISIFSSGSKTMISSTYFFLQKLVDLEILSVFHQVKDRPLPYFDFCMEYPVIITEIIGATYNKFNQ
jgi:hypothetical protein